MAGTLPRVPPDAEPIAADDEDLPPFHYVTPEEGRRIFDEAAREMMGMSGEEFIARWEAGEYDAIFDKAGYRHIGDLAALIPFARQDA